ncbi:MAG: hypothetical protein ACFBSE_23340 [Prochloraceae cyanobacterium]
MAKTEVIAAAFKISPPTLQKWLDGDKPTRGKYVSICQEIFAKFDYVDGEWFPKEETKQEETGEIDLTSETEAKNKQEKSIADKDTIADPNSKDSPQAQQTPPTTPSMSAVKEKDPKQISAKEAIDTPASENESSTSQDTEADKKQSEDRSASEDSGPMFSAVGIVVGEINLEETGNYTISIGNKTYPLFYARKNYTAFTGLKKEIATTGNKIQRLIVYPKFTHFPRKERPPRVGFQLVGFDKGREPNGVASELEELQFKLCGLWQFIPVCRQPCISIFRNFTSDRLDYIKQAEAQSKVNFMKASHLPILWRDSPVRPFRFNPKASKEEQGKTYFVQVKAVFLPHRDCFGFIEQLAEPLEKAPKFLKASKEDKATVQKSKAKNKPFSKDAPSSKEKVKPNKQKVINKKTTNGERNKSLPKLKK